jgi:hypothetical protein
LLAASNIAADLLNPDARGKPLQIAPVFHGMDSEQFNALCLLQAQKLLHRSQPT